MTKPTDLFSSDFSLFYKHCTVQSRHWKTMLRKDWSVSESTLSIYTAYPTGSWGTWSLLPGESGHEAVYKLDQIPIYHRAQSYIHTLQFKYALSPEHKSLDWGRKLNYPEETLVALGEHATSTHMTEVGFNKNIKYCCGLFSASMVSSHLSETWQ